MKKIRILLAALIIILLASCNLSAPKNPKDYLNKSGVSTWEELFKGYWSGLSDSYIFWNLDDKNGEWDDIYYEYLPKFKALGKINPNDMEEGILLLSDMSKNLSDNHFYFEIVDSSKANGKYIFSPSKYKIIKENNPNKSSDEIIKLMYEGRDFSSYYPKDLLNEKAQTILSYTFGLPLIIPASTISSSYDDIKLIGNNVVNPKIQERIEYNGQAVLYSSKYPNGSYIENNQVKPFSNSASFEDAFSSENGNYGPYYPLEDLKNEDDSINTNFINRIFESWTLCLGTSYQEYIELSDTTPTPDPPTYVKKHSASISLYSLAGITKDNVSRENSNFTDNTVYFLLSGFKVVDYISEDAISQFLGDFHDLKMIESAKGLIIDLRGNGGGANIDRQLLFGDLFSSPFKFGYQINKIGIGRQEYSLPSPVYIYPEPALYRNQYSSLASKPVAVITNIMTVSNGEVTTNMVKALEKGKQIGGKTLGGQGTLAYDSLVANAGQFSVGKYITTVYTPFAQILDANGVSHEGVGCIPDIPVDFDLGSFNAGNDLRLYKAFEYIRESN